MTEYRLWTVVEPQRTTSVALRRVMRTMRLVITAAVVCCLLTSAIPAFAAFSSVQEFATFLHLHDAMQTKVIVQKGSPVKVYAGWAGWRGIEGDFYAYWDTIIQWENASTKKIIGLEFQITLYNVFGDELTKFVGVGDPLQAQRAVRGYYALFEQVNVGLAGGKLVRVGVKRVKFSDGSVWIAP